MTKKLNKSHWYRRFLLASKGVLYQNPVLTYGLALPFAAVACTSLQTAVGLSIGALMALIPAALLMFVLGPKIPAEYAWLDYPCCAMLSAIFVMPTRLLVGAISPALTDSVGVYFSLFCVSSILYAAREKTKEKDPAKALLDLVRLWLGLTIVFLFVGLIREILGYGTIWNHPLPFMKVRFSAMMVSGLGFILLGFVAALAKQLHRWMLLLVVKLPEALPRFGAKVKKLLEREVKALKAAEAEEAKAAQQKAARKAAKKAEEAKKQDTSSGENKGQDNEQMDGEEQMKS